MFEGFRKRLPVTTQEPESAVETDPEIADQKQKHDEESRRSTRDRRNIRREIEQHRRILEALDAEADTYAGRRKEHGSD